MSLQESFALVNNKNVSQHKKTSTAFSVVHDKTMHDKTFMKLRFGTNSKRNCKRSFVQNFQQNN